jgi:hypothetical protein
MPERTISGKTKPRNPRQCKVRNYINVYLIKSQILLVDVVQLGRNPVRVRFCSDQSPEKFLPEIFFVIFSKFPHDDPAEGRIVDESVPFYLVDQVLDLRLGRVQAQLLHGDGEILNKRKNICFKSQIQY